MAESTKLQRLREIRAAIESNRYTRQELKKFTVRDTDGRDVTMDASDALEVLDRRIAAEEGA